MAENIRQIDSFQLVADTRAAREGILVLSHPYQSIFQKNAIRAFSAMLRRSLGPVKVSADRKNGTLVFRSGKMKYLVQSDKAKRVQVTSIR